jgi:hypothetical protein
VVQVALGLVQLESIAIFAAEYLNVMLKVYLRALQRPIHARPAEMVTMPNLRLLMPKNDLLWRMAALCFSSCDMPEK